MLENKARNQIIRLLKEQVVPAVGCTEPMAVALCTARAIEILNAQPEKITAKLSKNIIKNAMGVGIPGTGMIGLPIAIALGALIGKSKYQLEVIKDLTPESLEQGKKLLEKKCINIELKKDTQEKLYIELVCEAGGNKATAIIVQTHTNFVFESLNGEILLDNRNKRENEEDHVQFPLDMKTIYDFATTSPLEEISFILKTREYNIGAAKRSLEGNYGHCLGKTMGKQLSRGIYGNTIYSRVITMTASACDARMGGAMIPVMSNSGSGNQGICATNPVVVFAQENNNTEEELIRALILSHLTVVYIKQNLGTLSALCGCVVASIGASCAITYLMGGNYTQICYSIKNMIGNITGIICDGAKPSCSLKISSGVSTALLSSVLSMEGEHVTSAEGIVDEDIDRCIQSLTKIGKDAMNATDDMILDIMTHKKCY